MKKICLFLFVNFILINSTILQSSGNYNPVMNNKLISSLEKYEQYISSDYIVNNTIVKDTGYPFYLSGFAELYRGLSIFVNEDYLQNYNSILSYIISINNNWTWATTENITHPHYSTHFAKNFIDAYIFTKNSTYLDAFVNTVESLKYFFNGQYIYRSHNANFYAFAMICKALNYNLVNSSYFDFAYKLFEYSVSYYNESTYTWYQYDSSTWVNGYDGRAAYYQLLSIIWFLAHKTDIQSVFPEIYSTLMRITRNSVVLLEKYILKNGTYYYTPEVLDYTESASAVMYGFALIDNTLKTDHTKIIESSASTIIQRQRNDGAYFKSNNTIVEVWYTDNIPFYSFDFLLLFNKSVKIVNSIAIIVPVLLLSILVIIVFREIRFNFYKKSKRYMSK